jgi:UPF0716 family protein affecting phage T7 exclusion
MKRIIGSLGTILVGTVLIASFIESGKATGMWPPVYLSVFLVIVGVFLLLKAIWWEEKG